jgi:hypothetical protein
MGNATSVEEIPHIVVDLIVTFVDFKDYGNLLLVSKVLTVPSFCISKLICRLSLISATMEENIAISW